MNTFRGKPSSWLLKNSSGYPDFLFTILTYSMILLIFLALIWVAFAILAFFNTGTPQAALLVEIMDNMKTGLISLAGVVFGLAGSYTVRRYKKDQHYVEKKKMEEGIIGTETQTKPSISDRLKIVDDEEDI